MTPPELIVGLTWPLLWVHAIRTHRFWYGVIWLGLTSLFGAVLCAFAVGGAELSVARFGAATVASMGVPLYAPLLWGSFVYLGALYSKGFVERSRWKGRVTPFVVGHAFFATLIALPLLIAGESAGWWGGTRSAMAWPVLFLGALLFGLLYRGVTRFTEHDPTKAIVIFSVLPIVVAVHLAGMTIALFASGLI